MAKGQRLKPEQIVTLLMISQSPAWLKLLRLTTILHVLWARTRQWQTHGMGSKASNPHTTYPAR